MADWYYIGHYGQLGPLTREQMDELIEGGVILRETYVWRSGMSNWQFARDLAELADSFRKSDPYYAPPPPPPSPIPTSTPVATVPTMTSAPSVPAAPYGSSTYGPMPYTASASLYGYDAYGSSPAFQTLQSDRSRVVGGLLQILPGVGRMYLGYGGYGALQLVLSCFAIGWLWSIVDGIIILSGGVKLDGYGRRLPD